MKKLLFIRIPSACICFTAVILGTVVSNFLFDAKTSLFPLCLFCWIILCQGIDWLISLIPFKKWISYCLTESIILYICSLVFALLVDWISWTATSIGVFTVIFLGVDALIFLYFRHRQKLMADEINSLL